MNQGFKLLAQILHKWPKIFCIYSTRSPYPLYPQSQDLWKPNTECLIFWVTELQYKLKPQLLMVYSVKMMHSLGRKWNRNVWVLPGDVGDIKSLNLAGSFLLAEAAISPLPKAIGLLLPEIFIMVSSQVRRTDYFSQCLLKRTDYFSQCLSLTIFGLRPITSFKSQQAPKSEIQIWPVKTCIRYQKNYITLPILTDRNPRNKNWNGF